MDHLAFHFQLNGSSLHASCEDAIQQKMYVDELKFKADKLKRELLTETQEFSGDGIDFSLLMPRKCQFTHTDRSIQTLNSSMVSRSVETKPPSVVRFVAAFSQCTIFDEYIASIEKGTDESKMQAEQSNNRNQVSNAVLDIHTERTALSLKVLERMVNQNAEDEIFQDFKYWEDVSDLFRAGFGSLLPLWKFSSDRCKRKHVTALKWNPAYPDLFAVAYGSFDFMHQATGALSFFSLKNTSYPEYHFATESGVMTLDFHPQRSSLVAVGCYDGNVLVFDVRVSAKKPIYCSSIKTGKHTDPVWQVQWQNEEPGKDLFFFSVSSDGQVLSWSLSKSELKMEPAMQLKLIKTAPSESDDISFSGLAGGCCFDFSKKDEANFLVGTEEGKIHSCSKAYTGHYLRTFIGHNMAVYTNKWNPFHPDIFISCSADWTVKLWDRNMTNPVFSFDLGDSVGDVSWAPYSSTTFAAVTSDGKVCLISVQLISD